MVRRLLLAIAWGTVATTTVPAQSCPAAPTALVLAGGGAKGFAHIGVIQILDSLGLRPDFVVGTSSGAIAGALYASGYTGKQIDSLMRALPMDQVIARYEPQVSTTIGLLRPTAVWDLTAAGYALQSGAAHEGELNALMSALFLRGNVIARGNFDRLPIPFRAIATDLRTHAPVVLGTGDLARAIRASSAIPVILRPMQVEGRWLTDGGIAENEPVKSARALGAQRVWVSRLPYAPPSPSSYEDPLQIMADMLNSLFEQDSLVTRAADVVIRNATETYDNLDFSRAMQDSLVEVGRRAARTAFAAAACTHPAGRLAPDRAEARLTSRVTAVTLTPQRRDSSSLQSIVDGDAIVADLGLSDGGPLDLRTLQRGLMEIGRMERYREVWLNPSGNADTLLLHVTLAGAPLRSLGVGVAFDQFSSGRLWMGAVDRALFKGDAEAALLVKLGTYQQEAWSFVRRRALIGRRFVPLTLSAALMHESVRMFSGATELPGIDARALSGFLGLHEDASVGHWRYDAGLEFRAFRETYRSARGALGIRASIARAASDYEPGTVGELLVLNDYQRLSFESSNSWLRGNTQTTLRFAVGWGHNLPTYQTFALGGNEGFAGYRIGEFRGSQELFGSVLIRRPITNLLKLRTEFMAGVIARGYGVLAYEPGTEFGAWRGGMRVGVEAQTPIGPIRAEEGFSVTGERSTLIRVGYWF